uniref:Uncharacterized protein n=1 Tax=Monodelphis domestica TaxID=13616 RepID=A0A5F8H7R6_MONDO
AIGERSERVRPRLLTGKPPPPPLPPLPPPPGPPPPPPAPRCCLLLRRPWLGTAAAAAAAPAAAADPGSWAAACILPNPPTPPGREREPRTSSSLPTLSLTPTLPSLPCIPSLLCPRPFTLHPYPRGGWGSGGRRKPGEKELGRPVKMGNTTSCCVSSSPKLRRNAHSRLESYRPDTELSREDTGCNLQHISDRENIDGSCLSHLPKSR